MGHIDITDNLSRSLPFRFNSFYENLKLEFKKFSWDLLHHLQTFSNLPWLVVGNFNEILA